MVRKRVPLQLIPKDTSRRRTCRSRKNNLMKKAHEFRTLCGVNTCVIIYDPENPTNNPETYPKEREEVVSVIGKYFTTDGNRKMLGLPKFFEDRKRKAEKEVKKAREDNLKAKYPLPRDLIENLSRDQLRSLYHELSGKITRAKNRLGGINNILTSGNNEGVGLEPPLGFDSQLNDEVSWGASNQANNSYMKNLVDLPSKQHYPPIQYPCTGQHQYNNVSSLGNPNGTDFSSSGTFCNPGFLQYKENPNLFMQQLQPVQPVMQYMGTAGFSDMPPWQEVEKPGPSHSFNQYNYGEFGNADVVSSGLPPAMLPAAAKMEWQKEQQASSKHKTRPFSCKRKMPPKKMKMKTIRWSSVPEEVFYEILMRLPVKSLCRFKCVSKSWFSLISDPKFMSAHFDHSLANPKVMLISVPELDGDSFSELFCSVDYAEWGIRKWGNRPQSLIADYHGQISHNYIYSQFSQSVGGLSLAISWNRLLICNPSTREIIKLPPCPGVSHFCQYTVHGRKSYLGFDPIEKKYKVLSSWRAWIDSRLEDCRCYVLTLGEEAWRSVDFKYSYGSGSASICVDGVIYYIYRDENTLDLVAFDVRLETFRSMSLPKGRVLELDRPIFPMEYEGGVAVVYMEIQVIVMNILRTDISNKEEWEWTVEEHFVGEELKQIVCVDNLVGSLPNGELVFVSHYSSNLIKLRCYDVESKCMIEVRFPAPKDKKTTWYFLSDKASPPRVFRHAERLESLQGFYQYQRH